MYDKVKLWIPMTRETLNVSQYLNVGNEVTSLETGETHVFGCMNNLKVSIYTGGISIIGSLAKYLYHGSNVYPLNRETTKEAIEKLSDNLRLDISIAKVTTLEIGYNFAMKHRPSEYIKRLGEMPRMNRIHIEDKSLYYQGRGRSHPKVFIFYDKEAETVVKGMDRPSLDNTLRYEMRLKGRIPQQTGYNDVIASTLWDESFYRGMVRTYQQHYYSISKTNQLRTNVMVEIKTPKDAFEVFVARLINQGDRSQINEFLEELKNNKVFRDKKDYSRLKAKMEAISRKANITVSDELIRELDDDIKNVGAYV